MSQANAKTAHGAELWAVATGGSLAKTAENIGFKPPEITRGVIEASDHDTTGGMEFLQEALYNVEAFDVQMHYVAGSTADDLFIAATTVGGLYDFKVVVKAASGTEDITFSGYVTRYGVDDLPSGDTPAKQTCSATIKPSGDWAQAATP